jgi:hypothetical protein
MDDTAGEQGGEITLHIQPPLIFSLDASKICLLLSKEEKFWDANNSPIVSWILWVMG